MSIAPDLKPLLERSGLKPLRLRGRTLLPIVQGGMGVGVSAHRLAGSVAAEGGVGTISSVDLRRHHADLMERTSDLGMGPEAKAAIDAANLEALDREIGAARRLAGGFGLIAVNVMRAVSEYAAYVRQAIASGIDAVVVGAGLPLDLPELAADHPDVALVPILSDARGVQLVVRKWERKKRMPDAIVLEHPAHAGGHLGAARIEDLNDPRFDFERAVPETLAVLRAAGIESQTPVIAAGGIRTLADIRRLQALGASAVQLGTPFAVTTEGDAHEEFKRVLAGARDEDMVEFVSVAGLLVAFNGPLLIYEHYIMAETLFTCLLALALSATVLAARGPRAGLLVLAGLLFGLASATRQSAQVLIGLVPLALLAAGVGWRGALRGLGLALVGFLLVVLPWMGFDYARHQTLASGTLGETLVWRLSRSGSDGPRAALP